MKCSPGDPSPEGRVEVASPEPMFEEQFSQSLIATIAGDTALTLQLLQDALGRPITDDELEPRNQAYRAAGNALLARDYLGARMWLGAWVRRMSMWWASPEPGGDGFDLLVTPTLGAPPPEFGRADVLVRVAAALEEAASWKDRRPAVSA